MATEATLRYVLWPGEVNGKHVSARTISEHHRLNPQECVVGRPEVKYPEDMEHFHPNERML